MQDFERKIVEKELERMKRAYNDAQDRYAYGSRSAGNTMDKYGVLIEVLENALRDDGGASHE